MSYIPNKCPDCGANLDPGEKCDCKKLPGVKKYQKLPVVVEALEWTGQNHRAMYDFLTGRFDDYIRSTGQNFFIDHNVVQGGLVIRTLEGTHVANIGDFIIKGVKGEFYPCKPDIFKLTYQEVPDDRL